MEQLFNYEQLLVTVTVTQVKYLSHYSSDLRDYAVTLTNYNITADTGFQSGILKIQHSSIRTSLSPRTIMVFTQKRTERALNVEYVFTLPYKYWCVELLLKCV